MAVGAFFAVFDGGVGLFAVVAPGDGREGLEDELGVLNDRMPDFEVVPGVNEEVGHDAGDFADLEGDAADVGQLVFLGNVFE